jgi:hypothetical protein
MSSLPDKLKDVVAGYLRLPKASFDKKTEASFGWSYR